MTRTTRIFFLRSPVLNAWTKALSTASLEPGRPPVTPVGDRTARTGLAEGGYRCMYGTSFLMAVELTDEGPRGLGLLAYGQSGARRSEHHVDGTRAYAAKAVRPLRHGWSACCATGRPISAAAALTSSRSTYGPLRKSMATSR